MAVNRPVELGKISPLGFQEIIGALGKVYQANSLQQIGQDAVWETGLKNQTRISLALTTTRG